MRTELSNLLSLSLAFALAGGCDGIKGTSSGDTGQDTGPVATGTYCPDEADQTLFASITDPIISHCVLFDGPDEGIDPRHFAPGTCESPWPTTDPGMSPTFTGTGGVWGSSMLSQATQYDVCNTIDPIANSIGYGEWKYAFTASSGSSCSDYTNFRHDWVLVGAGGLYVLNGTVDCPVGTYYAASLPVPFLRSSTALGCTPGSATYDLVPLHAVSSAADGTRAFNVAPVARTDVRVPERAWLRTVAVEDWGSATNLHIAPVGAQLDFSEGSISGGPSLQAAAGSQLDLAVGAAVMSASFGVDGLVEGDTLPDVTLTWSCEVDPEAPHFTPVQDNDPYIADLSAYGVAHTMVFWVDEPRRMLRIAPLGRFQDAMSMHYDTQGRFRGAMPTLDARIEGRIDTSGAGLELVSGRLTIGSLPPLEVASMVFPPLQ